ncbi:hypothetical protein [Desmospora profundinema]|uniref:Uncharacterized protein n=1 Tax=Desmospora profundinema TaxID=1571184 RepID=A0ABU1IKK4_9BACL|nr:hypothetical protein [Desmospora profundinema]MDR6225216.1 hypothetical protein [Desmospora profundinema]
MSGPVEDFGPDWLVERIGRENGKYGFMTPSFGVPYKGETYYITVEPDTDQARVDHESRTTIPDTIRHQVFERAMELQGWGDFLFGHIDLDETAVVGEWEDIARALKALGKWGDRLTTAQKETLSSLVKQSQALADQDPTEMVGEIIREQEEIYNGLAGEEASEKDCRRLLQGHRRVCDILETHRRKAETVTRACQAWLEEVKGAFPARGWWSYLRYYRCVKEVESCSQIVSSTREELLVKQPYTLVVK